MTTIRPATLHRADDPRLGELASTLVGQPVAGARYLMPAGTGWVAGDRVHEVGLGVEVVTGSGHVLELAWATPGIEEGLSIGLEGAAPPNDLVDRVDVSGEPGWASVVGSPVEAIAVAFHRPYGDASARPWSVRIGAGTGVTVALGTLDDGTVTYLPDTLVVIFDAATARGYRLDGATAWGTPVARSSRTTDQLDSFRGFQDPPGPGT